MSSAHQGDRDVLEAVQKKAVKQIAGLTGMKYDERCSKLGLDSLEKRRWQQDIKHTFKIMRGSSDWPKRKFFF